MRAGSADRSGSRPRPSPAARAALAGRSVATPLGAGAWLAIAYLVVDYGKPQFYLTFLGYLKLGLWITLIGSGIIFIGPKHKLPRVAQLVLAFLLVLALDIPFASSPRNAEATAQTMLQMMLAGPFVMMIALDDVRKLRAVLWTYVLVGTYQGIQGIVNKGSGAGGYFVDENDLCMLAASVIPIAYFLGTTARGGFHRVAGLVLLGVNAFAGVVSFSRGGFLGMCAVLLYIVLRSRRRVSTLILIALALLVIYPMIPATWYHEMGTIETADQDGDTGAARLYMWGIAWKVYLDHPALGVGGNNLGRHMYLYQEPNTSHEPLWGRVCHSVYLTLISETGTAGTVIWALIVIVSLFTTIRVARKLLRASRTIREAGGEPPYEATALVGMCRGLEASLIGFLVAGAFLTVNYYPVMWSLVGFMAATRLALEHDPALSGIDGEGVPPAEGRERGLPRGFRAVQGAASSGSTPAPARAGGGSAG